MTGTVASPPPWSPSERTAAGIAPVPYKRATIVEGVRSVSGLLRALRYLVFLPGMWGLLLATLLREFILSPSAFLSRKPRPRRPEDVPLPAESAAGLAGLMHEQLDVGGGVKLHAASFGRQPDKPLLLLLHGFPECWYSWRRVMADFRNDFEVVALDTRGCGWSDKPEGISSYTPERLSADVAAVVSALGRTRCTLVGHDWGGAVAWVAAGRYPGLVERLVVLAAPHWLLYKRNLTGRQMAASSYFLTFQMPILPELAFTHHDAKLLSDIWLRPGPGAPRRPGALTAGDVEVYKAALLQPGTPTASLNYYRALLAGDLGLLPFHREVDRALRRQLDMPVLVVWGEKDNALLTSNLIGLAEVAPKSEIHILSNCSHWIQSDQPEELRRVLADWLADNPLAQQGQGERS
ncbi:hypothetical protein PLESTB_001086500 [Pleodorina starrii]|uniref:AB hydrolase-1 domain-containing protein n=1 Tax=Pleodorina starrii TaxID=330485 RepID=A0A9W6BQ60_9CHLO|nr:hypothetical protein PLESTM_000699700 [Pleodorina starrii]GLC56269.1 hypothetical protein PLESTB_001086500 [Pleodorina starrii]GLC70332.1 hypothetical protein PLESTF_000960500 [Pleodorina starrii]